MSNIYRVRITYYGAIDVPAESEDEAIDKARANIGNSDLYEDDVEITDVSEMYDEETMDNLITVYKEKDDSPL